MSEVTNKSLWLENFDNFESDVFLTNRQYFSPVDFILLIPNLEETIFPTGCCVRI